MAGHTSAPSSQTRTQGGGTLWKIPPLEDLLGSAMGKKRGFVGLSSSAFLGAAERVRDVSLDHVLPHGFTEGS